ncbi:hypothetical protein ZTR_09090 [Talaromyces verruculosus]|nr:hypothetical protein ZTR_09090 [Talaromyces verruculosus]
MSSQAYYELYRGSSLGLSLTDTLDDLINEGRIEPQLAMKILSNYDRYVTEILAMQVRARLTFKRHAAGKVGYCGHRDNFRRGDVIDNISTDSFSRHATTTQHRTDMPRLLPWLTKDDIRETRDRNTPTPTPSAQLSSRRRPRTPSPGASSHGGGRDRTKKRGTATDDTPSKGVDFLRSSRSPPTSAIASPPTEEYIIPGFENDDMYIMVEDEFYAIAQQFTHHLHHAEYVRRKKQAKKMNASVLRDMERPTDGTTRMSNATLRRKESERLHERQRKGLEPAVRRPEDSDDVPVEEVEMDDEEEEREDDPWYGTSLHTFMTSPPKNRSLVGLERIRSKTRAAAGFGSEVARPGSPSQRPGSSSLRADPQLLNEDPSSSSDEDDDLEIVEMRPLPQSEVRVRTSTVKRESPEVTVIHEHTVKGRGVAFDDRRTTSTKEDGGFRRNPFFEATRETSTAATKRSTSDLPSKRPESESRKETSTTSTKTSTSNQPRKRRFLDELDDDVTPKIEENDVSRNKDIIQDQPRKVLSTSSTAKESRPTYRTTSEQKQQDQTAKRSRIADIPTFLV